MNRLVNTSLILLSSMVVLFFSAEGFSAQVSKVRGKSVLIDTQGEEMRPGDIYFAIDLNGSRKAVLRINRVKGNRALATLGKGAAQPGMTLEKRGSSRSAGRPSSSPAYTPSSTYSPSSGPAQAYWGGVLGVSFDSLTADIITDTGIRQGTASTAGTSFSLKGLYDHYLFDRVWFRGLAGVESLKSSGGSTCGTNSNLSCTVDLMYLSADAIGRYVFSDGQIRPWAGGGMSLLFPMTKKSTLLRESSITTTYVLLITGGVDWEISPTMVVPISLEYGMFPKSNTVEASWVQLRIGLSMPL